MSSNSWSWKAIKDWFEFFLILAALCACGYIAWNQLIYLYLMLLLGGIAAGLAPIVSPLYKIPLDLIGLAPSLSNLLEISQDKLAKIDHIKESELQRETEEFIKAQQIIAHYAQNHPDIINQYPELREIYEVANGGQKRSQDLYTEREHQRQVYEQQQRQERQQWEQRVETERRRRGYRYGAPPVNECMCSSECPIRATENLRIYYMPGEREDMKVDWCFESEQHALADGFRRPKRQPPQFQHRGR